MVERTEIETYVRNIVALDILSRPMKSLSGKAERREWKAAENISRLIKSGYEVGERVFASVDFREEEEKARTLREGIEAFKKDYPKYGKILEAMIEETRVAKNTYLIYGLNEGYSLGSEDYIRVMMDLGFDREASCAMYPHLKEVCRKLKKANEQSKRSILL